MIKWEFYKKKPFCCRIIRDLKNFWILDPYQECDCKYCLPFCGLSFYSLNNVLGWKNDFSFDEVQFTNFFFCFFCVPLVSYLRSHCQIQSHKDLAYLFSSKSSIVLSFTHRSLIHFRWSKSTISFFYLGISSCPSTICSNDYPFPIECSWGKISWS